MDVALGHFGDARLQKGGSSCRLVLLKWAARVFVFGGLAEIGLARSG
jgi:hypothetical protein